MRALQGGRLDLRDQVVRHIDLCLGCRACEAACPSGVQYGGLLEHTREHIERSHRRSIAQRLLRIAIEKVLPIPNRLRLALVPGRAIQRLGLERFLPKFARDTLLLLPEKVSGTTLPEFSPAIGPSRGRVGLVSGCVMSAMFGETNLATVRLLNRAGWDVVVPRNQVCCGALYAHNGNLQFARDAARRNIESFGHEQFSAIIVNAAGCGSTLKEYGAMLADDSSSAERAAQFSKKVKDLSEWLSSSSQVSAAANPSGGLLNAGMKVTYHDACHLAHAQRITQAPRQLVKAVAGSAFVELPEADVCCGSAGTYNLTEPGMAERLRARKLQNILRTGAQIVVTSNPGCQLQIQAGLRKVRAPVQVMHIADFLDQTGGAPLGRST